MNGKTVLIQHSYYFLPVFTDMLRIAQQRHTAYCISHDFDYWNFYGNGIHPEMPATTGAWTKIWLVKMALDLGYEYACWLDSDAAILNFECDIRDALPADKYIGAALHDPAKSPKLAQANVPPHHNVGVMYYRNSQETRDFINAWLNSFPGDPRWMEQGAFNALISLPEYAPLFHRVDDTWNATVEVNPVEHPNIMGWHGVYPDIRRLQMMREHLDSDFLRFKV